MVDSFDVILKEIESLPKGNIYKKKIKNKTYYYHQYSNNGIKTTKYIKYEEIKKLIEDITLRNKKEKELKKILESSNKNLKLSKSAKELTGYIMSANKTVAEFDKGNLVKFNKKLCPLVVLRSKRLEPFLKTRSIDRTRNNSRLLRKVLSLKEDSEERISLSTYSISVSDNYWFKPKHSKLKYEDINTYNDIFFNLSLKGESSIYFNKIILTPDLTTNGSYEKGWKKINNEWYLYKSGSKEEIFSELFYSNLFELLNLPTAHYEYEDGYIKTKNFSHNYNFEPISSIAGSNDSLDFVFKELNKIDKEIAKDYLRLTFFDVILNNIDRHNENVGLLRDRKTGKIISLSPNYDNNLCLISRNKILNTSLDEGFLKYYIKLINKNEEIKETLKSIRFPIINSNILDGCYLKSKIELEVNIENIKEFILNRYNHLLKIIKK